MKIRRTQDQMTRDAALGAIIRALDTIDNVMDAANEALQSLNNCEASEVWIASEIQQAFLSARTDLNAAYENIQSWVVKGDRR